MSSNLRDENERLVAEQAVLLYREVVQAILTAPCRSRVGKFAYYGGQLPVRCIAGRRGRQLRARRRAASDVNRAKDVRGCAS